MSDKQPNVLCIVVDCARSDKWLGPQRRTATPVIDELAHDSSVFPNTITELAITTPCFASLLSGRYTAGHGVRMIGGYQFLPHIRLLPELMRERGYHAYAESTGPLLPVVGFPRGFDGYDYRHPQDYLHTRYKKELLRKFRERAFEPPWFVMLHLWELHLPRQVPRRFDQPEYGNDAYERAVGALDAELADLIDVVGEDAWIIFTGDHGEKSLEEEYPPDTAMPYLLNLLRPEESWALSFEKAAQWMGPTQLHHLLMRTQPLVENLPLREKGPAKRQRLKDLWASLKLIRLAPKLRPSELLKLRKPVEMTKVLKQRGMLDPQADAGKVGKMMERLSDEELRDLHFRIWRRTVQENYKEGHGVHLYDYLVRIPLVIRAPGVMPAGRRFKHQVRQIDILPTVLEALGCPVPDEWGIDGVSFLPVVRDEAFQERPALLRISGCPKDMEMLGIRTPAYKYVFGPLNPEMPDELYDLQADPAELQILAR
jgi:arylsulfatase A-like enzyme